MNLYNFVRNSPAVFRDPSGEVIIDLRGDCTVDGADKSEEIKKAMDDACKKTRTACVGAKLGSCLLPICSEGATIKILCRKNCRPYKICAINIGPRRRKCEVTPVTEKPVEIQICLPVFFRNDKRKFSPWCTSPAATLLHELVHLCGQKHPIPQNCVWSCYRESEDEASGACECC